MSITRVNFTLSGEADRVLDELAAEDALERRPNRSATLERLILAERDRRHRRSRRSAGDAAPETAR